MSVQVRYGSENPSRLLIVQDAGGFALIPANYPDPGTLRDVTYETKSMIGAMQWLGEEATRVIDDPRRFDEASILQSTIQALHCLNVEVKRLRRVLLQFATRLPNHKPNIPSFGGLVAESYHAVALKFCEERQFWLSQFVIETIQQTESRATLGEWELAKRDSEEIASRMKTIREAWPFGAPALRELVAYVNLEFSRAKPEPKPREYNPTTAEVEVVRQAKEATQVKRPTRKAVRNKLKEAGHKMSDAKIGRALEILEK